MPICLKHWHRYHCEVVVWSQWLGATETHAYKAAELDRNHEYAQRDRHTKHR
jgi:hypothetical protein